MRERIKFNYFAVFIFLAIIFFINTDTVFAKVGSSLFEVESQNSTAKPVEYFQETGDGNCRVYASSNFVHKEQKQFHLGWKAEIVENEDYEKAAQDGKISWTVFDGLISYPDIIMFEEVWDRSANNANLWTYKRSTGYLYLYVDSYYAKEQAAIWATYANTDDDSYIPLYYQDEKSGKKDQGEAFFGLNGHMAYLPLSNIKSPSGSYYAQNFTTASKADAEAVLEKIMTEGDSKQDVNGWQSWNDDTPFLMGNLLTDEVKPISSQYKWVTMFAIGAMGENIYDGTGGSYAGSGKKVYKVKKNHLKDGFEGLAAELGVDTKSPVFKNMITGDYNKTRSNGYYGFKDSSQLNGIDTVYFQNLIPKTVLGVTAGNGISKLYVKGHDGHNLINGEKLLNIAYETIFKDKGYNVFIQEM